MTSDVQEPVACKSHTPLVGLPKVLLLRRYTTDKRSQRKSIFDAKVFVALLESFPVFGPRYPSGSMKPSFMSGPLDRCMPWTASSR